MKKQASIRLAVLMALLSIAGMLATQRAIYSSQIATETNGYKEFDDRIEEYGKLLKAAEKSLPELKKKSKQEVIAAQQDALVNKIREMRSNAKRGDIFTPNATEAIARGIKAVFAGPDGRRIRNTIQAGEPLVGFKVEINQRYPDTLPHTTMPPTLLQKLPRLPEEMAFRILGSTLLLVDRKANIIVDFMPNAIP